jgi:signal transduction histidine kinase
LWELEEEWLAGRPSFAEVLERLHLRRRLPEHANFPLFKRQLVGLFTTLLEPTEDLWFLPDGTTLRQLVVPHPFGGVLFVQENVTSTLALESSLSTLTAVQRETLDNLSEGVAVFGGDGRLKLFNPSYAALWGVPLDRLAGEPHITMVLDLFRDWFDYRDDWEGFREEMIATTLERTSRGGRLVRVDGSVIEFNHHPLPDGAVLVTFLDVSDTVRVERSLRAANAALEVAEGLKSGLISHLSFHLRQPLNAVVGFSEMLVANHYGVLAPVQGEIIRTILQAGWEGVRLLGDILELAMLDAGFCSLERRWLSVARLVRRVLDRVRETGGEEPVVEGIEAGREFSWEEIGIMADEHRVVSALAALCAVAGRFCRPGVPVQLFLDRSIPGMVGLHFVTGLVPGVEEEWRMMERDGDDRSLSSHPGRILSNIGICLALARRLVVHHGGQMRLTLEDGALGQTRVSCLFMVGSGA